MSKGRFDLLAMSAYGVVLSTMRAIKSRLMAVKTYVLLGGLFN